MSFLNKSKEVENIAPRSVTEEIAKTSPSRVWFRERGGRYAILVAIAICCSLVMMPNRRAYNFDLSEADIGNRVNQKDDIKAPWDLTIEDSELTQQRQAEARAKVKPIYDYDVGMSSVLAQRIFDSFQLMNNIITANERTAATLDSQSDADDSRSDSIAALNQERLAKILTEERGRFEKILQSSVTDEEYSLLAQNNFSGDLAELMARTLKKAMGSFVVSDLSTMMNDSPLGYDIQTIPTSSGKTTFHNNLDGVLDVTSARANIPSLVKEVVEQKQLSQELIYTISNIVQRLIRPNLTLNNAETVARRENAEQSVPPVMIFKKKGEIIWRNGERLNAQQLVILNSLESQITEQSSGQNYIGVLLICLLAIFITLQYWQDEFWKIALSHRDLLLMGTLIVISLLGVQIARQLGLSRPFPSVPDIFYTYFMPLATGAMILRLVMGRSKALVFIVILSILSSLLVDGSLFVCLYILLGSMVGSWGVSHSRERSYLFKTAGAVTLVNCLAIIAIHGCSGQFFTREILWELLGGILSGAFSILLFYAITPVIESLFGYITDFKLLELGNLNHPLLRRLMVEAPGTHHHSVMVSLLAEAAAPEIGANPLKVRVMAYYHDIGKMKNPRYFAENQNDGINPHDKLAPSLSAMILKRHVTDGIKIAQEYKLGELIESAIIEHHGTTITGFYRKAQETASPEDQVSENDYRYPGRKPQTKEAALLMLADSVEAAVKSIKEPNPDRIMQMITKIINGKFTDEQLNDCALTLKDLHIIAKNFNETLKGMNYTRPEYASTNGSMNQNRQQPQKEVKEPKETAANNETKEKDNANNDQKQAKRPDSPQHQTAYNGAEGIKHLGQV